MSDDDDSDSGSDAAHEAAVAAAEAAVEAAEAEVAQSEQELEQAQQELEQVQQELEQAEAELEKATAERMVSEQQVEKIQQCADRVNQLQEQIRGELSTRLSAVDGRIDAAQSQLLRAEAHLQEYLNSNPSARDFHNWITWQPQTKAPVTPDQLNARFSMKGEQLPHFIDYLSIRDQQFQKNIDNYRQNYAAAHTDAERQAIQTAAQRNLGGLVGEKIAEYGLRPMGTNVSTQGRTYVDGDKYTKTDLKVEGLNAPIIMGRGERLGTTVGGSLAVEVKCGKADYLYSQKDHMTFQAGGHKDCDASMTLCTRDIKDLSPEREKELRDAMREAGSPLIGMLPRKEEIDNACWNAVIQQ